MNKQKLIQEVSRDTGLHHRQIEQIVETCLKEIGRSLQNRDEVRLVGFGSFFVGTRKPSAGRNPRSGEAISIEAVARPKFRPGKTLKEMVSRDDLGH